jgi:DNA polymerase-3 subunit epsilon
MLKHLALTRPLAVIDLETTGTNPLFDRIVEASVLKLFPDGERQHLTRRLNPGVPIPAEASAVHGIVDADVAHEPCFRDVAADLLRLLDACDLCGFNLKRFDLRLLQAEFQRVGLALVLAGRAIIDPMEIFHAYERRDLAAAVRFYLGREHSSGHCAAADALATAEVLDAMLARYTDLPRAAPDLHQHFQDPNTVDTERRFTRVRDHIRFAFGKYRGQALGEIARLDPDYLRWMLGQDFSEDTKAVVKAALRPTSAPAADARQCGVSPADSR